ncbi:MAG: hypothetical protein GY820_00475 [Gammaproteobacteria bacterium]|nr:hypothetical protein [Gammaproteobacteria bacterium]
MTLCYLKWCQELDLPYRTWRPITRDAYIGLYLSAMETNLFGIGMLNRINPPKCTLKSLLFAELLDYSLLVDWRHFRFR